MNRATAAGLTLLFLCGSALAQSEPITSPEDAACRDEARSKLFSAPNPQGLGLYDHGAQLYRECMARSRPTAPRRTPRRQRQGALAAKVA